MSTLSLCRPLTIHIANSSHSHSLRPSSFYMAFNALFSFAMAIFAIFLSLLKPGSGRRNPRLRNKRWNGHFFLWILKKRSRKGWLVRDGTKPVFRAGFRVSSRDTISEASLFAIEQKWSKQHTLMMSQKHGASIHCSASIFMPLRKQYNTLETVEKACTPSGWNKCIGIAVPFHKALFYLTRQNVWNLTIISHIRDHHPLSEKYLGKQWWTFK